MRGISQRVAVLCALVFFDFGPLILFCFSLLVSHTETRGNAAAGLCFSSFFCVFLKKVSFHPGALISFEGVRGSRGG